MTSLETKVIATAIDLLKSFDTSEIYRVIYEASQNIEDKSVRKKINDDYTKKMGEQAKYLREAQGWLTELLNNKQ